MLVISIVIKHYPRPRQAAALSTRPPNRRRTTATPKSTHPPHRRRTIKTIDPAHQRPTRPDDPQALVREQRPTSPDGPSIAHARHMPPIDMPMPNAHQPSHQTEKTTKTAETSIEDSARAELRWEPPPNGKQGQQQRVAARAAQHEQRMPRRPRTIIICHKQPRTSKGGRSHNTISAIATASVKGCAGIYSDSTNAEPRAKHGLAIAQRASHERAQDTRRSCRRETGNDRRFAASYTEDGRNSNVAHNVLSPP